MKTTKELLEMELHVVKSLGNGWHVMRVFGGWIYYRYTGEEGHAINCFVPEEMNVNARI